MRRVVCTNWGPPSNLEVQEVEPLAAGPGQVVIDVEAAGVNYVDGLFVLGTYQIKFPPPFTPGGEVAGRVREAGGGVNRALVGRRVMASCGLGGYASQVAVAAEGVVVLPDSFDAMRAAAFIQSYCTVWFALTRRTTLAAGESMLVLGAGGGVGQAAIDVGRALGANVIAAAGSKGRGEAALVMGATAAVDYETEDLKTRVRELTDGGVDVVLDPIGGRHADAALRSTRWFGRYVVIGFAGGSIPSLPANQILLNNRTVVGVDWGAWSGRNRSANHAMLTELVERVGAGQLHPVAPTSHPLEAAGQVLTDALERRITGKVVLVP